MFPLGVDWVASSHNQIPHYPANVDMETINKHKAQDLRQHYEATIDLSINPSVNQPKDKEYPTKFKPIFHKLAGGPDPMNRRQHPKNLF